MLHLSCSKVTFMCLTYLPQPVRESVHFASCGHIASQLMALIMGPQVAHINMIGFYNFSLDLSKENLCNACFLSTYSASPNHCISSTPPFLPVSSLTQLHFSVDAFIVFADTCGVPQLRDCFGPLEQV